MKRGGEFVWLLGLLLPCAAFAADRSQVKPLAVFSKVFNGERPCTIYLPVGYALSLNRFPVLYFLHSENGSADEWAAQGCQKVMDDLIQRGVIPPMAVVLPQARAGLFVDAHDNSERYRTHLLLEVIPYIETHWRVGTSSGWPLGEGREIRGISGVSTGGTSALSVAFNHPKVFGAVSAHSPLLPDEPPERFPEALAVPEFVSPLRQLFGQPTNMATWQRFDPLSVAKTMRVPENLDIYFDCGKADRFGLARGATQLDRLLNLRKIPHTMMLYEGDRGWDVWKLRLAEAAKFHAFSMTRHKRSQPVTTPTNDSR